MVGEKDARLVNVCEKELPGDELAIDECINAMAAR
jgi:hypothetical protein